MANTRFVSRRGPKRRTAWEGAAIDISDLSASPAITTPILVESILEGHGNPTIIRIRGNITVTADTTSSSGSLGLVTIGFFLADSAQVTVGVSAMPLPFSQIGSDWIYWDQFVVGEQVANEIDNNGISFERHIVDNKSMRKVKLNHALQMVAEIQSCEGTVVANICGVVRILLKLS